MLLKGNPGIREALTVAPAVVYSPIPLPDETNRFDPDTAIPIGPFNPESKEAFTVAPDVVYSPTVPPLNESTTKRLDPDTAIDPGLINPNGLKGPEMSVAFTVAPEVVYSPTLPPAGRNCSVMRRLSPRAMAGTATIGAATKGRAARPVARLSSERIDYSWLNRVPGAAPVAAPLPVGILPHPRDRCPSAFFQGKGRETRAPSRRTSALNAGIPPKVTAARRWSGENRTVFARA